MYDDVSAFLLNQDDVLKKGRFVFAVPCFGWKELLLAQLFFCIDQKGEIDIKSLNIIGPLSLQFSSKNH